MTATTRPPRRRDREQSRPIRISFMESLGFSDAMKVWSDQSPPVNQPSTPARRGRHEALAVVDDQDATNRGLDLGEKLGGTDVRWRLVAGIAILVAFLSAFGWWLYQRPETEALATLADVRTEAENLRTLLGEVETIADRFVDSDVDSDTSVLSALETSARQLFTLSASLPASQSVTRAAAADAAGNALDLGKLIGGAISYRQAVMALLVPAELETDPTLIELDEAARAFGEWQARFDETRTALASNVLPEITERLDVLSGDLSSVMTSYVDALRDDDEPAVVAVLGGLADRLAEVETSLESALADMRETLVGRIDQTREALSLLVG